nr:tigger transposable element-derived protein 1-like [Cherax quadricarinatus]XP_053643176.1 tigger transposable element-derived protein 1-like [Cherax quadricarinatus]XP_053643177.1 tigger transposable element-derived protein 1-like [Cherax quadricarinatus]XP_053643178.1 tigger transposable element-derived protein 1-like [Cherax quadricarinatus]
MGPKKASSANPAGKRVKITMEMKKEIIAKYESGVRVSELARLYTKPQSTISTIVANKTAIKEAVLAKGASLFSKQRSQVIEDVERLLLVWINEKQIAGDSISQGIICEKARKLHDDLIRKKPATSGDVSEFKASKGWFERFKNRSGIHSVMRHGEAASSDKKAAEKYVKEFKDYIDSEEMQPEQVFNCDETGLFWKKMPSRTYITEEEKALPGHKPMKDRLTLLMCANASGDCKVKPLLVYHSETPRAFRQNNVVKANLCVMWRANSTTWVTRDLFYDWLHHAFAPTVKNYLMEKKLDLKCLLVLDSAPGHPSDLAERLSRDMSFIKVKFLPPNTTPLLQPMDQQVISNFKKLYTKAMFQKCFEETSDTRLTLREFWEDHFSILICVNLIGKAWEGVTKRTLNSAWKKLWPQCVEERDFEVFGANPRGPMPVVESIVALGKSMGLEVSGEDVKELVEEDNELTTEELQDHLQQQEARPEETASEEGREKLRKLPTSKIKEMCAKWVELQTFMDENHPDTATASVLVTITMTLLWPILGKS